MDLEQKEPIVNKFGWFGRSRKTHKEHFSFSVIGCLNAESFRPGQVYACTAEVLFSISRRIEQIPKTVAKGY